MTNNRIRKLIRASLALAGFAACLALAGGCSGPPKAQVSGDVTLDGVVVEEGVIQFNPATTGQTASGAITNGKYQLEASVGDMKVSISARKVTTGKTKAYDTPDSPYLSQVTETIPQKYNLHSELKVTLKPGVNMGVDFELKSK